MWLKRKIFWAYIILFLFIGHLLRFIGWQYKYLTDTMRVEANRRKYLFDHYHFFIL